MLALDHPVHIRAHTKYIAKRRRRSVCVEKERFARGREADR